MLKTISQVILVLGFFGSSVHAATTPAQLEQNWHTCNNSDSSWYRRWGQYVFTFDKDYAAKICRSYIGEAYMAGCENNENWLKAGFYCYYQ